MRADMDVDGEWAVTIEEGGASIEGQIRLADPRPDAPDRPRQRFEFVLPEGRWSRANSDSFANVALVGGTRLELLATFDPTTGGLIVYADITGSPDGWSWLEVG